MGIYTGRNLKIMVIDERHSQNSKWVWSEKKHNHKLHTNTWHREEEPHNNHESPGRQTQQSNQLSVSNEDACKTRMDIK